MKPICSHFKILNYENIHRSGLASRKTKITFDCGWIKSLALPTDKVSLSTFYQFSRGL